MPMAVVSILRFDEKGSRNKAVWCEFSREGGVDRTRSPAGIAKRKLDLNGSSLRKRDVSGVNNGRIQALPRYRWRHLLASDLQLNRRLNNSRIPIREND